MHDTQIRQKARFGFTLIEILVVIAIIAILVGLTTAAVMKFLGKGPEVQNMNDVRQLEAAVAAFNQDFKITGAFPSRIKLCGLYAAYGNTKLDQDSVQFLVRMFPNILRPLNVNGVPVQPPWKTKGIAWGGPGTQNKTFVLEGDQCLVFFLGGIPSPSNSGNAVLGFSRNQNDPSMAGGTRYGPYFNNFQSNRLVALPHTLDSQAVFFSYMDAYGTQPFLYFSSNRSRNGYNAYTIDGQSAAGVAPSSDCQPTGAQQPYGGKKMVWPYHDGNNYLNPNGFQIISAGANGKFGPGTDMSTNTNRFYWNASTFGSTSLEGQDDQTNFSDGILGAGP